MLRLLAHFSDNPLVGYWHDFGHVQLKHNLGLLDHSDWLHPGAPPLIRGPRPHGARAAPATLDYASLLTRFPAGCPLVWELSPTRDTGEIIESLAIWRHLFPDRACSA